MIKIIKFVKVFRPVFLLILNFWWILETTNFCLCVNRVTFNLFKAVINFSLLSQAKISAWFSEQIFSKTTLLCDFILFNLNFQLVISAWSDRLKYQLGHLHQRVLNVKHFFSSTQCQTLQRQWNSTCNCAAKRLPSAQAQISAQAGIGFNISWLSKTTYLPFLIFLPTKITYTYKFSLNPNQNATDVP